MKHYYSSTEYTFKTDIMNNSISNANTEVSRETSKRNNYFQSECQKLLVIYFFCPKEFCVYCPSHVLVQSNFRRYYFYFLLDQA